MATQIKFGTSGWRAIVAEEFTIANIRRAVTGIAKHIASHQGPKTVLVGRDPRFLGEAFVAEAAKILLANGVTPIVIPEAAPTPGPFRRRPGGPDGSPAPAGQLSARSADAFSFVAKANHL